MGFTFKRFHVDDDKCAMKVGTDSVLLGSLADVTEAKRVLDIGSGSGLLALMLTQRIEEIEQIARIQVVGVEIQKAACIQSRQNIVLSPWSESIAIEHTDINTFTEKTPFDLIVSNPPYFIDSLASPDSARNTARHTVDLSQQQLIDNVLRLLAPEGRFWLILPTDVATRFETSARESGLYCYRQIQIHTKIGKPVHRVILAFSKIKPVEVAQNALDVYDQQNQYSRQFIALTQNFYLNR